MSVLLSLLAASVGWTTRMATPMGRAHVITRAAIVAKSAPEERGPEAFSAHVGVGSICEFHDPKHGSGKSQPVLGICESSAMKAKGGEKITLVDSMGKRHCVAAKSIHIVLPPSKGKATEPAEILKPYNDIIEKDALSLGVDPEMLELAWEFCDAEQGSAFSPKDIVRMIDEKLYKTATDQYRAFRLLSSDLGKVFFKSISDKAFKPKAANAVKASKEQWCQSPGHGDMWKQEFCFV
jgi:hypothetical protein